MLGSLVNPTEISVGFVVYELVPLGVRTLAMIRVLLATGAALAGALGHLEPPVINSRLILA
jgi:hypothetical protein